MHVKCKYSGIEFKVEHFPFGLSTGECAHPVFSIPQSKLVVLMARKYPNELSQIDSYLGFIALLQSTGHVLFRNACTYKEKTSDAIVAQNMESLIRVVGVTSGITHPAFTMPRFVVSPDTGNLATVQHWISIWAQSVVDFQSGNKKAQLHDRIVTRERVIERLIKDPSKNPANYAGALAEWAALAGEFPTGTVPVDGKQIPLCDYWKSIIRKAARADNLFSIDDKDLAELIEHCEDTLAHGSIYAHTLMKCLRDAQSRKKNFLGLGDFDLTTATYKIISDDTTAESANLMAMIDSAPENRPVESNYPSKIAYLRALMKFQAAQDYKAQQVLGGGASADDTLKSLGE